MKIRNSIVKFILLILVGGIIFVGYNYFFGKENMPADSHDQSIEVSNLLKIGIDGQTKQVYGNLVWTNSSPELSSGGQSVQLVIDETSTLDDAIWNVNNVWVTVLGVLSEDGLLVASIGQLESDIHGEINYFNEEAQEPDFIIADSFVCEVDTDCVHFEKTGECSCGCHNNNFVPNETNEECLCQAPTSCACVNNKCEGVIE
jgi:hypothetical protein